MTASTCFAPIHGKTGEPVQLAMQRLWLTGQILPAGARLTVQHVFRSAETQPIEVIYAFPLPRDAALRRFRITGDGFEAHSELRETEAAVKAYEEGIAQGSLATLARQYGDGLINLTVGNIRPGEQVAVYLELIAGVELRDDGFRFRFPFTLAPAYHARARCAVVAGEGEMEMPADEFGDAILPRFREDASALHQVGFELTVESALAIDELGSPSHAVRVKRESGAASRVALAAEKAIPNRDLVLDAHYRAAAPQVLAGAGKDGKGRFAAIVPSTAFGARTDSPRRVVILLDRSGSMQGAPLTQASKAIDACLAALSETDFFGLAAFDDQVEALDSRLLPGTRENRGRAHRFLETIGARGGTELARGFQKAVELLERGGGDVLILTDGQVGGTERILAEARQTNTRLHCLGIGSASQDRFLALLARETGGVSRFVTPRERVDLPAVDLFASIGRPVASGLKVQGNVEPEPPASVFAGTPVLLFGEAQDGGRIEMAWDGGGSLALPVAFAGSETGDAVWLLQGARLITDWESRYPSVEALAPIEKRQQSRVASRLRELSQTYGLASREMSLVAVVKRAGDRPGQLPETRVVSVGMPQDTRFAAYFHAPVSLAPYVPPPGAGHAFPSQAIVASAPITQAEIQRRADDSALQRALLTRDQMAGRSAWPTGGGARPIPPPAETAGAIGQTRPDPGKPSRRIRGRKLFGLLHRAAAEPSPSTAPPPVEDSLLAIASAMDSDGGMPGGNVEARAAASVSALLAFLANGHTPASGAFRSHAARLVRFLESLAGLDTGKRRLVDEALAAARNGQAPAGDWLRLAQSGGDRWGALAKALGG
jgi:Ca-activated chloride channel family protein